MPVPGWVKKDADKPIGLEFSQPKYKSKEERLAEAAAEMNAKDTPATRRARINEQNNKPNIVAALAGRGGIRPMLDAVRKIAPQQAVRMEAMNKQMFPA